MTLASRCVYWSRKDWKDKWKAATLFLVTCIATHVDEFGESMIFPMGRNSGCPALPPLVYHQQLCVSPTYYICSRKQLSGKNGDQLRVLETSSARMFINYWEEINKDMFLGLMHKQGLSCWYTSYVLPLSEKNINLVLRWVTRILSLTKFIEDYLHLDL
jgi:hypothetical protein